MSTIGKNCPMSQPVCEKNCAFLIGDTCATVIMAEDVIKKTAMESAKPEPEKKKVPPKPVKPAPKTAKKGK